MSRRSGQGKTGSYIVLTVLSVAFLFPFIWLLRSSFMTSGEIFAMPMQWLPSRVRVENFAEALTALPFARYFLNTIFIVAMNVGGTVLSSSFVAFGFARISFPGRNFWFALLLSTLMIPVAVVLIPQFIGWKLIGAYNTFWPLTFPAFFGNAFFVFLVRQFFMTIPREYDEAGYMDGASYFVIYSRLLLPMSRPALATVGVFAFMFTWNDFFGPLIYLSDNAKYTLALGLRAFMGEYTSQWHLMMAASFVIILPMIVLYFFAQRAFVEGITLTGVKG
jgi:multiple sugar transport system permease protein